MSVPVGPIPVFNDVKQNHERNAVAPHNDIKQDNEMKKIADLLSQYGISSKPLSSPSASISDQKGQAEKVDIYTQCLSALAKDTFIKDTIHYYLVNQGKIKERRVAFLFPGLNNMPVAVVLFFKGINKEASINLFMEIDFNQKDIAGSKSIDKLSTDKSILKDFKNLYINIQFFFLGSKEHYPKDLDKALKHAYNSGEQQPTMLIPQTNEGDSYCDALVGLVGGLLKFGNGSLRHIFTEILKDITTNKEPVYEKILPALDTARSYHALNYAFEKKSQTGIFNPTFVDIHFIFQILSVFNVNDKARNPENFLSWLKTTCMTELKVFMKNYEETKLPKEKFINSLLELKKVGPENKNIDIYNKISELLLRLVKYEQLTRFRKQLDEQYQVRKISDLNRLLELDFEAIPHIFRANPTEKELLSASCQILSNDFIYDFLVRQHSPKELLEWLETHCSETCEKVLAWRKVKEDVIKKSESSWTGKLKKAGNFIYNHSLMSVGVELFSLTKPLVNYLTSGFLSTKNSERMVEAAGLTSGACLTYLITPVVTLGQTIATSVATRTAISYWNHVEIDFERARVIFEPTYKQELSIWYPLANFGLAVCESIITRKPQPVVSAFVGSFLSYGTSGIAKTIPGLRTAPGERPTEFQTHCHNVLSMAAHASGSILTRYAMDTIAYKIDARDAMKKKLFELHENGKLATWVSTLNPNNAIPSEGLVLKGIETPEMITTPSLWFDPSLSFDPTNPMLVTFQADKLKYEVECHALSNENLICTAPKPWHGNIREYHLK